MEGHQAQVGRAHSVDVGVGQSDPDGTVVTAFDDATTFPARVASGFDDVTQRRSEQIWARPLAARKTYSGFRGKALGTVSLPQGPCAR